MSTTRRWLSSALLLAAVACGPTEVAPDAELVFVRDGVLAPPGSGGQPAGAFEWVERAWTPGEAVQVGRAAGVAPRIPECVGLFSVELGDVARLVAMGGAAPDTALAFSPDGARLAVGSYRGEILVLDAWTGEVAARRRLAETMVKGVAWSPDGGTLYASEQSPDAFVHALDPATLEARWSVRLAEHVESSPAPDGEDLYGVYTLPAAYHLEVLPGGDLLVAAAHGWNGADGARLNRSRLLRLGPDGAVKAAFPADGAADATFTSLRSDPEGGLAIVVVGRTAAGEPPAGLPVGGVQVVALSDLTARASFVPQPLAPHFTATYIWLAVDVDAGHDLGVVGLSDGRVYGFPLSGGDPWLIEVSTPVMAGEVPISASVGFGWIHGDSLVVQTSGTNIPYGSASPSARPPSAHPSANALFGYDLATRELRWTWRGTQELNGLQPATPPLAVLGTREGSGASRGDAFGGVVLDLSTAAEPRERAFCATEGPTFFRPTMSPDGRVAVAEHPWMDPDGEMVGGYRVTVLR